MKFIYHLILVLIISALAGTLASANQPAVLAETIISQNTVEASLFILPDGSGAPLSQAVLFGGQMVDASIAVTLVTDYGAVVRGFPREDIWLSSTAETENACSIMFIADTNTDASGVTRFIVALAGGGATTEPLWVYLLGQPALNELFIAHPQVPLRINSADINGDLNVDLSDVALFAADFHGPYNYRSDFHWDGVVNLVDVVKMAAGLGAGCQ